MASFNPKPIDLSQINSGQQYVDGDGVSASALNDTVEAAAYASQIVEDTPVDQVSEHEVAELVAGSMGVGSVSASENPSVSVSVVDDKAVFNFVLPTAGARGTVAFEYNLSGETAPDSVPYSLTCALSALITYADTSTKRLGDIVIVKYGTANTYGQNELWCYISAIGATEATLRGCFYVDGQKGANGQNGTDGTTFTPSVSNAGVISWSNDGGKQNPASVDLVAAVIAALPVYDGTGD